jgi:hypothetical protein
MSSELKCYRREKYFDDMQDNTGTSSQISVDKPLDTLIQLIFSSDYNDKI